MTLWRFYWEHALRDIKRNRQRTLFALFCIAAGVAAVVSLGMLGVMIEDALTVNVAALNRGDLQVRFSDSSPYVSDTADGIQAMTAEAVTRLEEWAAENNASMMVARNNVRNFLMAPLNDGEAGRPANVRAYFVEAARYPFYDTIRMVDPAGLPLAEALLDPRDVVISENLADRLGIRVGQEVLLSLVDEPFVVRGIVPIEAESFLESGPEGFLFGYLYLDYSQLETFDLTPLPNVAYFQLPPAADLDRAEQDLRRRFSRVRIQTRDELLEDNQVIAGVISDFVMVMGVAALVVGGVGIVNTMLVIVGRRTVEIAVLKTHGMKGRQITALFLVEAVLLGILGSILGVLLGLALSLVAREVGEAFLQQTLRWRLSVEPIFIAMVMGIVVTAVFGLLPTLTAGQVRPSVVLRPNDALLPRAGIWNRIIALGFLIFVLGIIGSFIVGDWRTGFLLAGIGIALLGILLLIFWVIVWVVGKLPAFGWIDLKLALRAMSARRMRSATALLSLTGGVFALAVITLMSYAMLTILNFSLTNQLGGNIIALPLLPGSGSRLIEVATGIPGVTATRFGFYDAQLIGVNGVPSQELLDAAGISVEQREDLLYFVERVVAWDASYEVPPPGTPITAGRRLNEQDATSLVAVVQDNEAVRAMGIYLGDVLQVRLQSLGRSRTFDLEVVGLSGAQPFGFSLSSLAGISVPYEAVAGQLPPTLTFVMVNAPEAVLTETLLAIGSVPGVLTYELSALSDAFERFTQQMSAIPLLVAGLALFAGATIIANTVSLATLERRREIGILKAIGLKGRRVLGILLLENAIIGFVGGLMGIGVSLLLVWVFTFFNGNAEIVWSTLQASQAWIILALSIGIAVLAALLTAWGASRETPMNVLRYE